MKKKKRICRLALTMMMAFVLIFSSVEAAYATTLIEALSSGTVNPVSSANYKSGKNFYRYGLGWKTAWTGKGTDTLHAVDGHGNNYSGAKTFTPAGYKRSGNVVVNKGSASIQTKNLKFGDYTAHGADTANYIVLKLPQSSTSNASIVYKNLYIYDPDNAHAIKTGAWKGYVSIDEKVQIGGYSYTKRYSKHPNPYIEFAANVVHQHPSICTWNVKWIKLNFYYTYSSNSANGSDAGKPYQISANASYGDIDAGQAVSITNKGLRATGVAAGNASAGKIYWRRYQTSSGAAWSHVFTDHTAKATDPNALTAAGYAFSSTSSNVVTSETLVFVSNQKNSKGNLAPGKPNGNNSYYETNAESMFAFQPLDPVKFIKKTSDTDGGGTYKTDTKSTVSGTKEESTLTMSLSEAQQTGFTYEIEQAVPAGISTSAGQKYDSFSISDEIDTNILEIDESNISVYDIQGQTTVGGSKAATTYFNISTIENGQNGKTRVTASATAAALKSTGFYKNNTGATYTLIIPVKLKSLQAVSAADAKTKNYFLRDGDGNIITDSTTGEQTIEIPDVGSSTIKSPSFGDLNLTGNTVTQNTGSVYTQIAVKPNKVTLAKKVTNTKTGGSESAEGFEFVLTNETGTEIARAKTDSNGKIEFANIFPGKYVITEVLSNKQVMDGFSAGDIKKGSTTLSGGAFEVTGSDVSLTAENTYTDFTPSPPPPGEEPAVEDPTYVLNIKKEYIVKADTADTLSGYSFLVEKKVSDAWETVGTYKTDASGLIRVTGLKGGTYKVTEKMSAAQSEKYRCEYPSGGAETVNLGADSPVALSVFKNTAKAASLEITKTSSDGKVSGIKFTVTADGFTKNYWTDQNGKIETTLKPGTYSVFESDERAKYYKHDAAKTVTVKGDQNEKHSLSFTNTAYTVTLKKYEKLEDGTETKTPVKDAEYEVYRVGATSDYYVGQFTTNENGEIELTDIEKGEYYFKEIVAPHGYTLSPVPVRTVITDSDIAKTVTDYNQRTQGAITINKTNTDGELLDGAHFALYDANPKTSSNPTVVASGVTADGYVCFEGLSWGKYYLTETKAPTGYQKSDTVMEIDVGPDGVLDETVDFDANPRKLGSVVLTKRGPSGSGGEEGTPLAGAQYSLYTNDGTCIRTGLATNASGELTVTGLDWGSYYFLETSPPAGYEVNHNHVIFTVTAATAGKTQYVTQTDGEVKTSVTVTKRVKKADLYAAHGDPTFTFKLVDSGGQAYYRNVTFENETSSSLTADSNGYISLMAGFNDLDPDTYTLTECETSRYDTASSSVSNVTNGTVSGKAVNFNLSLNGSSVRAGTATYTNEKTDWSDYSGTDVVTNSFKAKAKITAISAIYERDEEIAGTAFDRQKNLTVEVIYDNGAEKELTDPNSYDLYLYDDAAGSWSIWDGTIPTPSETTDYRIKALYTEDGKTYEDEFTIHVNVGARYLVSFITNGGEMPSSNPNLVNNKITVGQNTTLAEIEKTYPGCFTPVKTVSGKTYYFAGWYTDSACSADKLYDFDTPITSGISLFALWDTQPPKNITLKITPNAAEGR